MSKVVRERIRRRLIAEHADLFSEELPDVKGLKSAVKRILEDTVADEHVKLTEQEKARIIEEIIDDFTGFGPIEGFMKDPLVTEIMINGPDTVYIERLGVTTLADVKFDDEKQLMYLVHKILAPTRRHADESHPFTDVSLKDGSRVNIIIAPLALNGPTVTIRKFLKEITKVEDLIRLGTLDERLAEFLVAAIKAKLNIVFSGATGAGKTTTLNVLSSYIFDKERIVTIEDTAELRLAQRHVVRLEARQSSIEGRGEVTIRDLFKNSLRMRPDRIILGEIRGAEALDMLQAICSGHAGSLAVIHAHSTQDVIYRLETMILASGVPITLDAIHRQIAAGIQLIVQQEQLLDGSRKITHIAQVNGLKDAGVIVEDLFSYESQGICPEVGVKGAWKPAGIIPKFYPQFKKAGVALSENIFKE